MDVRKWGWKIMVAVLVAGAVVLAESISVPRTQAAPASVGPAPAAAPDAPPPSNEVGEFQQQG